MVGALLAATLTLAPGIRLVDAAPTSSLELMSKQQLENELLRLQTSRPRLLGPIILIPVGAVAALGGLVLLNAGAALVFSKPALVATFMLAGGAVLLLGGVVVAILGIVQIGRLLAERKAAGVEMDRIEQRLQSIERMSNHDWVSVASF